MQGSMLNRRIPRLAPLLAGAVLVLAACGPSPSVTPSAPASPGSSAFVASTPISAAAVGAHLEALQTIADANGGVRTSGTPGYDASVDYVAQRLRDLGYAVETPDFEMATFTELPGARIQVGAGGPVFEAGRDFHAMIYSAGADLTATVAEVGFDEAGRGGCAAADWTDLPDDVIAVVPPGPCFRRQVVLNAVEAGALAVIVGYPQWPAGEVRRPTLLDPDGMSIPAISASAELGEALRTAAASGAQVHVSLDTEIGRATVRNVIAESHAIAQQVVMLGGHLDSVHDGPGINDNGSGTAALLEVARLMADEHPGARIRLAFWGGEEFGLFGSQAYVDALTPEQRGEIGAYLNFDMLGSPNAVPFVYDQADAASGSAEITDYLVAYLESVGIGAERTDPGGGSDHAHFAEAGIPTGGIFSGASELKSSLQAEAFGGSADEPMDACYHLACDTVANVDVELVATFADAAVALTLAIATGELAIR